MQKPPNPDQSNQALMNKLKFSLGAGFLSIYSFRPSVSPSLTDGTIVFLAGLDTWISAVIQNVTTEINAVEADRSTTKMSTASYLYWY